MFLGQLFFLFISLRCKNVINKILKVFQPGTGSQQSRNDNEWVGVVIELT